MNKHLLIVGLLAVGLPLTAGAWSTNYVDVGRSGLSLNTGTNWANAYTNLGDALAVSWTNDRVWVAAGTYYPTNGIDRYANFNVREQVSLYGGFTNGGSMADRNWNVNVTVLSGDIGLPNVNTDNCYNVVTVTNDYTTIDGVTIRDGYNADTTGTAGLTNYGAGIVCWDSVPSNIVNCTFFNNVAGSGGGGALYFGKNLDCSILISNCLFVGNSGAGSGGAMRMASIRLTLTITHCGFYDNEHSSGATGGGAIYLRANYNTAKCIFKQCRFVGNSTAGGGGAVVCFHSSQYFRIRNCLFAGNGAAGDKGGGAIAYDTQYGYGSLQVDNCTLAGNYGKKGGGIAFPMYVRTGYPNNIYLTNNILWDNVSLNNAGGDGMYIFASPSTAYVGYVCSQGGLVYPAVSDDGTLSVSDQGGNITNNPLFATNLYSGTWKTDAVYSSNTAQTVLTDTDAAWPVNGLAGYVVNPHVGDRASGSNYKMFHIVTNNATSLTVWGDAAALGTNASSYAVNDYHLPANSSCVNSGTNNRDWLTDAVDLDGSMRLRYGAVDMGAYECIYKGTVFVFR